MKKKGRLLKAIAITLASVAAVSVALTCGLIIFAKNNINFEADELLVERSLKWEPTKFYARDKSLGEAEGYIEVGSVGDIRKDHYPIEELSPYLTEGFVAVEDHRFYEHKGVDVRRTLSAAVNYIFGGGKLFGGSTITQQLIKNVSGDNELSAKRKLSEIIRACHIERLYSKDEILEVYLNIIPMSENIFGVGEASRAYFGKEPCDLLPEEAATLIGITNAPTAYNPYNNPERCTKKRNTVLKVMHEHGILSDGEYEKAVSSPLSVRPRDEGYQRYNSWYVEMAAEQVARDLAKKYSMSESAAKIMLMGGGYSIYTNMDVSVQSKLESYFSVAENLPCEVYSGLNYAMVVTDSQTGELLGIVGRAGKKQGNGLLNHATVPHTPASALKPLSIYAPLIESGEICYSTVLDDTPVSFRDADGEAVGYPKNSPDVYQGLITVKDAVRLSKNTVAMKLCRKMGARGVYEGLVARFGFDTLVDGEVRGGKTYTDVADAPMALGQLTDGVSLLDLTSAFGSFPSEGIYRQPVAYERVVDMSGNTVLTSDSQPKRVFSRHTARIMNQLLSEVTASGTAKQITLKEIVDTAGKTGTSSGNKDKLFVGYTPYLTAGIWCGYDKANRGVYSLSKSHLEIWDEIMSELHLDILSEEAEPRAFSTDGLIYAPFCMDSGKLLTDSCMLDPRGSRIAFGYFTEDTVPNELCDRHILCDYDVKSKGVADPTCPKRNIARVALLKIPERSFEHPVDITDAEFVCRSTEGKPRPDSTDKPYFQNAIPEGSYVGVSGKRRQFNCAGKKYRTPFDWIFG
ncbi:MAG: penicillin-binding protein [Clostridia bacterium]|nr:penicillin-binding protein [Clostridia bacterium]